jgi:hypothetical protein
MDKKIIEGQIVLCVQDSIYAESQIEIRGGPESIYLEEVFEDMAKANSTVVRGETLLSGIYRITIEEI